MAWVHCHIARQPVTPYERAPATSGQISSIVMKLLAKTAEDRYQTAAGVVADLQRCLTDWETRRRIIHARYWPQSGINVGLADRSISVR
jgi:hypothetical protein